MYAWLQSFASLLLSLHSTKFQIVDTMIELDLPKSHSANLMKETQNRCYSRTSNQTIKDWLSKEGSFLSELPWAGSYESQGLKRWAIPTRPKDHDSRLR